jgi:hypothetical protein
MAKTKMKRTVARRRNKTRIRKRKNVIRGGVSLAKSVAILSYLFGEAKNEIPESVQTYVGEKEADAKVQFNYLNDELGSDRISELLKDKTPDTEIYPELTGYDWNNFNWDDFVKSNAMEAASKKL